MMGDNDILSINLILINSLVWLFKFSASAGALFHNLVGFNITSAHGLFNDFSLTLVQYLRTNSQCGCWQTTADTALHFVLMTVHVG